ncbi:MAG TPA: S41 family peptidase, partial [Chloroflexia bacterium]
MPQTHTRRFAFNAMLLVMLALLLWGCTDLPVSTQGTPTTVAVAATRTPRATRVVPLPTERILEDTPTEEVPVEEPTDTPEEEPVATPTTGKSFGGGGNDDAPTEVVPTEVAPTRTRAPRDTPTAVAEEATPIATVMPSAARLEIFTQVWETVRDNYLYDDYRGADWDALRDEHEALVNEATTGDEFYLTIDEMIAELEDDHSRYISPWEAKEEDDAMTGNYNYVGVGIFSKYKEDSIQIVYVFPGSPAEEGGLQRRDLITAVDGIPIMPEDEDLSRVRGPEGTTVTLTIRSPGGEPRDIDLVRRPITGKVVPTSHRLEADPSVGYMIIPSFDPEDMDELVDDELAALLDGDEPLEGIVIDLRGNGGGLLDTMERIVGQFLTGRVGIYASKGSDRAMSPPRGSHYRDLRDIPLVVLVDEGSESASEMMTAALQYAGRAQVVGVPSAGNTETVFPYDFDDGSRLWLAEEGFQLPDGTTLEGTGVIPEEQIDVDWSEYPESDDPHILKAIELIEDVQ